MRRSETLCLIRGGGDMATGVGYRLYRAGFPIVVTELAWPLAVRRAVAFAEAVYSGEVKVEDVRARHVPNADVALQLVAEGYVSVLVDEKGESLAEIRPVVVVDGRMAKVNIDTRITDAPFVVGLGPGFTAGEDCHALIETKRGHHLGRVIWQGMATPNDGLPEPVKGYSDGRILRAPCTGTLRIQRKIGDLVIEGERLALVEGETVEAPFTGILRGIAHDGLMVTKDMKIGDIDPRAVHDYCFEISDKALAVGGGVLEAVLNWLNTHQTKEG